MWSQRCPSRAGRKVGIMPPVQIWIHVANGRVIIVPYSAHARRSQSVVWSCTAGPFWLDFYNGSPFDPPVTPIDGTEKQDGVWSTTPQAIKEDAPPDSYPYRVDVAWHNPGRGGVIEFLHHDSPDIIVELT